MIKLTPRRLEVLHWVDRGQVEYSGPWQEFHAYPQNTAKVVSAAVRWLLDAGLVEAGFGNQYGSYKVRTTAKGRAVLDAAA